MRSCHYIAVFCLQVMLIVAVFGYPGELTGSAPDEEEAMYASDENSNKTTNITNPENLTNSDNLTEIDAAVTSEIVTDNSISVESNYTSEYENDNSTSVESNVTSEYENDNNDDVESATPQEYEKVEENENQNNDKIESLTPYGKGKYLSSEEAEQQVVDVAKIREERRKKRKDYVAKCVYTRYVRIQDEYGCEMCTCIYEKSMMLCTPFECKDHGLLAHELDPMTYNDYILGVPTHFSEYKCDPGQVFEANVLCECKCVRRDILSCPVTCQLGRPLN